MSSQVTIQTGAKRARRTSVSGKTKKTRQTKFSGVPRSLAGIGRAFPEKLAVTHKYATIVDAFPASKTLGRYTFKCNGLFDPDDRLGGHQPLYFDQLTPIYNHYVVLKAKMKATFMQNYPNNATNPDCVVAVTCDDDTSTTSVYETMIEIAPSKQVKTLGANQPATVVMCPWSAAKTFGSNPLDNPRLQGTSAADPTELSHFTLSVYNNSGVAQAYVAIMVEITYDCVWFELKTPTQS